MFDIINVVPYTRDTNQKIIHDICMYVCVTVKQRLLPFYIYLSLLRETGLI